MPCNRYIKTFYYGLHFYRRRNNEENILKMIVLRISIIVIPMVEYRCYYDSYLQQNLLLNLLDVVVTQVQKRYPAAVRLNDVERKVI